MKVYYHDGFLRVSLKKYDKHSTLSEVHLTNTSQSAQIIKRVKETGEKFMGMNLDDLEEFQIQTLEDYSKYLYETKQIDDPHWLSTYLVPQIKRSFIALAKINEENFYKSSDVYEMYGVDIILDEEFNPYILEVNASPMIYGSIPKKLDLLNNMLNGIFNIVFAQQFSRVERTLQYIEQNKEQIKNQENLKIHSEEFKRLYQNHIEDKYKQIEQDTTWELIYDESIEDVYGRFKGLIAPECIDLIEKQVEAKKKMKLDYYMKMSKQTKRVSKAPAEQAN